MRLCIGNIKSKRFTRMVEVVCIEPHPHYDNILYIQDTTGAFYTLTFQSHEALSNAMVSLKDRGFATMFCEIEYVEWTPTYDPEDYNRELDLIHDLDGPDYER